MRMPSFIEPHRTPLRKSEKVWSYERFFFIDDEDDEKFLLNGSTYGAVSASRHRVPEFQRPHVGGKFLFVGTINFGSVASLTEHSDRVQAVKSTTTLMFWRETFL